MKTIVIVVNVMSLASLPLCSSYSIKTPLVHSRRKGFENIASSAAAFAVSQLSLARIANAKDAPVAQSDLSVLQHATVALSTLLGNWERATTDCTYADVPRELLDAKNKEMLLEKASEFALFDKSTSVVSCKRTNRIVRDYIGATGKGPLVGAEKRLLKKSVVEKVDPESVEEYFSAVESFSQALSRATSLSYTSGVSDFDSFNNFAKDDSKTLSRDDSNLEQARKAIEEANSFLKRALSLFPTNV
ncbi:hypothetical protein ACHAWX_003673 [Stephanocyclus meneghinianus]